VREALEAEPGGPTRSLLTLDAAWPGRAGVVVGDLATAAYVDIVVPGMYYPVTDRLVDWTEVTARLQVQQTTLLGTGAGASGGVAAVAWIGYRTPDLTGIATLALAEEGAERLQDAIQGIQGLRRDDPPYLTVIAHSYGSTAAMLALSSGRASVDALAVVGSPGGAVREASQLDVPAGRVYVGEAPWDPVVGSSLFGQDPGSPSFGAELFGVGGTGGRAGVSADGALAGAVGHNSYFDRGTESFRNLALIGIDRPVASVGAADASGR
jgi:pimeloyl-ACP methyl ester carboxylesterase